MIAVVSLTVTLSACSTDGDPTAASPASETASLSNVPPTSLIVDASDSMLTADAPGRRIDAAKAAATALVDALPDTSSLSVLTYGTQTGNTPAEYAAGCRDIRTLVEHRAIDKPRTHDAIASITPRGFTPIAAALTAAAKTLPARGRAAIVLVSDGEDTCGQPPCPVARALVAEHPDLEISTIGFKTTGHASDELRCIASSSNGLFVQAANAAQLESRLLATQNKDTADSALIGGSLRGIGIGTTLQDIRKSHADFPLGGRRQGDQTIIVWAECEWVFGSDGRLTEIRPQGEARTIDGVRVGGKLGDAHHYYGDPVATTRNSDGTDSSTFIADPGSDNNSAYVISSRGSEEDATITRIVVCGCAPRTTGTSGEPASDVLRPVTKSGATTPGWLKDASHNGNYYACETGEVPGTTDDGLYWCSGSSGMDQGVCAPSFEGHSMLCVTDPFSTTLYVKTPSSPPSGTARPAKPPLPFGLQLADGTRCMYVLTRGMLPQNSNRPTAVAPYQCGTTPSRPSSYVYADKNTDPIHRATTGWTVDVGEQGSGPIASTAITKVIYVGLG